MIQFWLYVGILVCIVVGGLVSEAEKGDHVKGKAITLGAWILSLECFLAPLVVSLGG